MGTFKEFINEIATKDGAIIEFKINKDVGAENRGWRRDVIEAHVDGKNVGEIRLDWIPKENFKKYYPGILQFAAQIQGKNYLPYQQRTSQLGDLNDDQLRSFLSHAPYFNPRGFDSEKKMSHSELLSVAKKEEVALYKTKLGKDFKEFENFWVDKVLVGYITVDNKRQGIGLALYAKAAEYLHSMNLQLYKSDTISDSAKAVWDVMSKRGWTAKKNNRTVLNYNSVKDFLR